jgi:DAK2 domain fusion protein YloV
VPALEKLDAAGVRDVMVAFRDALHAHREGLNRLNVYPVPDGDTGTNMALTLDSVVSELDPVDPDDMGAVCKAISQGSLMGARGNSGVILSQILRGFAGSIADGDAVDGKAFGSALSQAADSAYGAVMEPVEGTILTVVREAADAASGESLIEVVESAARAARAALERTPELLQVLAEAGVVDAGGAGLVLLFDAVLNVVDGRPLPEPEVVDQVAAPSLDSSGASSSHAGAGGTRYEVMYFLEADDDRVPDFKQAWARLGDSIVVVGGDGLWNCHIHTDDIGASIEAGVEVGRPRQIRVTDLAEQIAEAHLCDHGEEPVATAAVSVVAGDGMAGVHRQLGARRVVAGGQTMNPSTADILAAVEATGAEGVVVLPNNPNIVAVAEQVPALASKPVVVVPTRGPLEGITALMQLDPAADVEANAKAMKEAVEGIVSGEVTRAVRDASTRIGPVTEGDWLGLKDGVLVASGSDVTETACALLDELVDDDHELVTIVEGTGASAEATERIRGWLDKNRTGATVETHDWGHPLSAYLFCAE